MLWDLLVYVILIRTCLLTFLQIKCILTRPAAPVFVNVYTAAQGSHIRSIPQSGPRPSGLRRKEEDMDVRLPLHLPRAVNEKMFTYFFNVGCLHVLLFGSCEYHLG